MSTPIFSLCIASGHTTPRRDPSSNNLTVHDGKWAVCPAGREDGHHWQATTGLDYEDLFRIHVAEKPVGARTPAVPHVTRAGADDRNAAGEAR